MPAVISKVTSEKKIVVKEYKTNHIIEEENGIINILKYPKR